MAKRFQFDDEDDDIEDQYQQPSHIDELESMRMAKSAQSMNQNEYTDEFESFDDEDNQPMSKKKKKFVWKWWHYLLIGLGVLLIAFAAYIFFASQKMVLFMENVVKVLYQLIRIYKLRQLIQ